MTTGKDQDRYLDRQMRPGGKLSRQGKPPTKGKDAPKPKPPRKQQAR